MHWFGSLICIASFLSFPIAAQPGATRTIQLRGNASTQQVNTTFRFTVTGAGSLTGLPEAGVFQASHTLPNLIGLTDSSPLPLTGTLVFPSGDSLFVRVSVPAGFFVPSLGQPANNNCTIMVVGGVGALAEASGYVPSTLASLDIAAQGDNFQLSGAASLYAPYLRTRGAPTFAGSLAHIASGAGWKTSITLVNSGISAAQAQIRFYDDAGSPLTLPLLQPQTGATNVVRGVFTQTIVGSASLVIETNANEDTPLVTGSAQLWTDGIVSAYLVFRHGPTGQEASVPLQVTNPRIYGIAFDNTAGKATGVAVTNAGAQTAVVFVGVKDDAGVPIGSLFLELPGFGHTSFVLSDRIPAANSKQGVIEILTPTNGQLSLIGIRAAATGAFTTIPAISIVSR